jgi:DNA-binding transcriptional regulator YhcF (GntR family)
VDDSQPVFAQIMEIIENGIITGVYAVDDIIISTTQISKVYSVNPTTAVKAIGKLTDDGILYKKPGIGMCVANGAREKIINRRKEIFLESTINKLLAEAKTLGIPVVELIGVIQDKEGENRHD